MESTGNLRNPSRTRRALTCRVAETRSKDSETDNELDWTTLTASIDATLKFSLPAVLKPNGKLPQVAGYCLLNVSVRLKSLRTKYLI